MSAPAAYDLNDIMDALKAVFDGTPTGETHGGEAETFNAYSEVPGQIEAPAVVLELDGIEWDENMGDGADSISIVASVMIDFQDDEHAQRSLRAMLSREGGVGKLKAALEASKTLNSLVSYAHMTSVRRIGIIRFNEVDYLGAEIDIEVMS